MKLFPRTAYLGPFYQDSDYYSEYSKRYGYRYYSTYTQCTYDFVAIDTFDESDSTYQRFSTGAAYITVLGIGALAYMNRKRRICTSAGEYLDCRNGNCGKDGDDMTQNGNDDDDDHVVDSVFNIMSDPEKQQTPGDPPSGRVIKQ